MILGLKMKIGQSPNFIIDWTGQSSSERLANIILQTRNIYATTIKAEQDQRPHGPIVVVADSLLNQAVNLSAEL
jgi:hypothetical protein